MPIPKIVRLFFLLASGGHSLIFGKDTCFKDTPCPEVKFIDCTIVFVVVVVVVVAAAGLPLSPPAHHSLGQR